MLRYIRNIARNKVVQCIFFLVRNILIHKSIYFSDDSVTPSNLTKTLDEMERYLNACQLLENHNIHFTYSELKNIIGDKNEMESLLIKTSRNSMYSFIYESKWTII